MRINLTLFSLKKFNGSIYLNDKSDSGNLRIMNVSNHSAYLNYSIYLVLTIPLNENFEVEEDSEEDIEDRQSIFLSFFDMYGFNNTITSLLDFLESEYLETIEHVELGSVTRIKDVYKKKAYTYHSITGESRIAFKPIVKTTKNNEYLPMVRIAINSKYYSMDIGVDRLKAILYNLKNIDLHSYALNLSNTYLINRMMNKRLNRDIERSVTIE